jgi:hypothetical protein
MQIQIVGIIQIFSQRLAFVTNLTRKQKADYLKQVNEGVEILTDEISLLKEELALKDELILTLNK